MRTLLLVLIMAAPTAAGTVTIGFGDLTESSSPAADVQTIGVFVALPDFSDLEDFFITGVTVADESRTWTIDESNAASYGFDWAKVESWMGSPLDIRVGARIPASNPLPTNINHRVPCVADYCVLDFALERIDVTLVQFFNHPLGSIRHVHADLVGTGRIVPEPPAAIVACWLLVLSVSHRRHSGGAVISGTG